MKQANKAEQQKAAEPVERRVSTEGNLPAQPEAGSQYLAGSEEKLARIRAIAREDKGLKFVNLLHHISQPLLHRAYRRLKKKAATGVDGETWASYGKTLETNISNLHKNVQDGRYKAKAVLRKWIDKSDGSKRPLGITCVEDKILQQAMVWVLESIYEQDFLGFSYGFRPERNQHNALEQRLVRFNLTLHPKKTKLIEFGRFACGNYQKKQRGKPETFDFLGFTHICSKRLSDGKFTIRRHTIAKRQCAKLNEVRQWLKKNYHRSITEQGQKLKSVITGAMNYYGVPGNGKAIAAFRTEICKSWLNALRRRSQKADKFTWKKMQIIISIGIPLNKTTHPYPSQRLCV